MSKRTKSKLRNFKIFLSKEVFNGRYIVRNSLVATVLVAVIAVIVGIAVLSSQEKVAEVEVAKPVPQSYTLNSLDTDVIRIDSISYLLADLDADTQTKVEANQTIVVSESNQAKCKVVDNEVFIRAEASYMGDVIATAYMDEEYIADKSKSDDEWTCIRLDDGSVGYINTIYITFEETEDSEAADETESEDAEGEGTGSVTEAESSGATKPVQSTGSVEKAENTTEETGSVTEDESTTEATTEAPTTEEVTTEEPTTEATTEAPATEEVTTEESTETPDNTEQDSVEKPQRDDTVVDGGVPVETTYRSPISLSEEDINLMASVVTLESGGESYDGQLAVANVIINRMLSGHWGSTVSDVVYAPYQFSCMSSPMLEYYLTNGAQASCRQAVEEALSGVNNIGNYMCFKALYAADLDDYSVYTIIGNHVFH